MATTAQQESELVRAVKQMIEVRASAKAAPEVTLFGKKISCAEEQAGGDLPSNKVSCPAAESIEKLLAATAKRNLTELYKQHLRRRGRGFPDENAQVCRTNGGSSCPQMMTLPLLGTMDPAPGMKRQKTEERDCTQRISTENKSSSAQLTIFYKGLVYVFDDVPMDKAKAMMVLAGNASDERAAAAEADLPQARKASLQRFLEKRKERLSFRSAASERSLPISSSSNSSSRGCKATSEAGGGVEIAAQTVA